MSGRDNLSNRQFAFLHDVKPGDRVDVGTDEESDIVEVGEIWGSGHSSLHPRGQHPAWNIKTPDGRFVRRSGEKIPRIE